MLEFWVHFWTFRAFFVFICFLIIATVVFKSSRLTFLFSFTGKPYINPFWLQRESKYLLTHFFLSLYAFIHDKRRKTSIYSPWNMKLKKQYCFGTFCDTKILFAWFVKLSQLQNVLQRLLDPQALRNLKYINPILRNCNFKEERFKQFCLILRANAEKQAKMPKSYLL